MKKDLVAILKQYPNAVAIIDNDCWQLYKSHPDFAPVGEADYAAWEKENLLAKDGDIEPLGDGGYGSGNCYGGDILQALAIIHGLSVESV